ncbi:hypothetical protein [Streptomyces sp. NBC_01579]|uniref:hypothetical protein n=1 Tax=Streptomyces sp. NBC_01579 TaxID=2975885 RepID=UPI0038640D02
MALDVTRFDLVKRDAFSEERMSGMEANIAIRGELPITHDLHAHEFEDRDGNPLRVVARTSLHKEGAEYVESVVTVFEQPVTGTPQPWDWFEGEEPQPPAPKRQPVKVGDRVTAMPDGNSLGAGLVTSVEWKQRDMQPPYDRAPLWTWEWRVVVWFGGDQQREGRWSTDWVGTAAQSLEKTQESFRPIWQKLEAGFAEGQAAE